MLNTDYKIRTGMLAWILHRVTGVGVLIFLFLHVADTSLIALGPEIYNKVISIYHLTFFRLGEVALGGCVLFHALNGVRVILFDFFPSLGCYHKQMFWTVALAFVLIMLPAGYYMLLPILH